MKTKALIVFALLSIVLSGCGPKPASFDIFGSPNPLYYGGTCPTPVLTLKVTGPGEGLRINSIIAAYQLFDGSGKKVYENTASLNPVPDAPSVTYDADRIISVPDSGGSAPDSPIYDFGEGHVDFAATVYAKILSPSPTGPDETYFFTSTKSVPVLPCSPKAAFTLVPPRIDITIVPPGSLDKPKPGGGGSPPSCSVDPNNPNCVPGP